MAMLMVFLVRLELTLCSRLHAEHIRGASRNAASERERRRAARAHGFGWLRASQLRSGRPSVASAALQVTPLNIGWHTTDATDAADTTETYCTGSGGHVRLVRSVESVM